MSNTKTQIDSTQLSAEAQQALREKRLKSTARCDKLLSLLRELAVFDDSTDAFPGYSDVGHNYIMPFHENPQEKHTRLNSS